MRFAGLTVASCVSLGAVLTCPARAQETSTQIWADLMLALPQKSDRWYFEIDIKTKAQLRGDQKWANTDIVGLVEYYPFRWFDATGELVGGFTVQNNDVQTLELTPRFGLRLHLASNIRELQRVGEFATRIGLAILLRIEDRNFWYFGTGATQSFSSEWRFRIRPEARIGINRADRSRAGTWYLFTDAEIFLPLEEKLEETFATRWRVRIGPGYTLNEKWRFELLYIRDNARNTFEEDFAVDVHIIDLRFRHYF